MTDHGPSDGSGARPVWRQWQLPATQQAPALARQLTREVLAVWQRADLEETAVLIVSELVTNAVRHASTGRPLVALRLETAGASVRIEVHDDDPRWPEPSAPDVLDESGFGFVLVSALAAKWGVNDTAAGKAVWAELADR